MISCTCSFLKIFQLEQLWNDDKFWLKRKLTCLKQDVPIGMTMFAQYKETLKIVSNFFDSKIRSQYIDKRLPKQPNRQVCLFHLCFSYAVSLWIVTDIDLLLAYAPILSKAWVVAVCNCILQPIKSEKHRNGLHTCRTAVISENNLGAQQVY